MNQYRLISTVTGLTLATVTAPTETDAAKIARRLIPNTPHRIEQRQLDEPWTFYTRPHAAKERTQ